jgi:hypothetical protein
MSTPAGPTTGATPAAETVQLPPTDHDDHTASGSAERAISPRPAYVTELGYAARLYGIQIPMRGLLYLQSWWDWLVPAASAPELVKGYDVRPEFPVR